VERARLPVEVKTHFKILGLELSISGPAECIDPVSFAYRAFVCDRPSRAAAWVAWGDDGVETDRGNFPAVAGLAAPVQFYPRFLDRLYDGIGDFALIHAAVVVRAGEAVLLAAPSGHGKSTLALELARRGWTLFSDDFAPIGMDTGTVFPFPRAVGIVPGSPATPRPFAEAAAISTHEVFGKRLVDASAVADTATLSTAPARVSHVFLLEGDLLPTPRLELSCPRSEAQRLEQRLAAVRGLRIAERISQGSLDAISIESEQGSHVTEELNRIALDPAVVFSVKRWSRRATWDGGAACTPVSRRETAQQLARELLNRRPGGRLMDRYGGDTVSLVVDLAATLRSARCWRVEPGALGLTADKIEEAAAVGP